MIEPVNTENIKSVNGVYFLSEPEAAFESKYIELREKENRLYPDDEATLLPETVAGNPHGEEWKLRRCTFKRFLKYILKFNGNINLLDIGCGNGWFSAKVTEKKFINTYAVDINKYELEQAARVFSHSRLKFFYGNIFEDIFKERSFSLITLNSSIQYFPDLRTFINRLFYFLAHNGEIHILDSHIYKKDEIESAKERSASYYSSIGFPEMAKYYHHHSFEDLKDFHYSIMYNPGNIFIRIKKSSGIKDSPFPWIKIVKR